MSQGGGERLHAVLIGKGDRLLLEMKLEELRRAVEADGGKGEHDHRDDETPRPSHGPSCCRGFCGGLTASGLAAPLPALLPLAALPVGGPGRAAGGVFGPRLARRTLGGGTNTPGRAAGAGRAGAGVARVVVAMAGRGSTAAGAATAAGADAGTVAPIAARRTIRAGAALASTSSTNR